MLNVTVNDLPGLNCGVCGYRTCDALAEKLPEQPDLLQRCIQFSRKPVAKAQSHTDSRTGRITVRTLRAGGEARRQVEPFPRQPGPGLRLLPRPFPDRAGPA